MPDFPPLWSDILSSDDVYRQLKDLKDKGWTNEAGDRFFQERRKVASNPTEKVKYSLYRMTSQVGAGLAADTEIFKSKSPGLKVLDLCMAPGGFTTAAAKNLTEPFIDGMTLPPEIGGYEVIAKNLCQRIIYSDITMYPSEMGYEGPVPEGHPDARKFETHRPLLGNTYGIVFCGGAVGRDHPREEYRKECEGTRLTVSQTVFAMNHLNPGGSIVLLLHRIEAWDTVCLLNAFNQFSEIELYKHPRCHAIKSSFYLVARNIDLEHPAAKDSVSYWRSLWRYLTFKDISEPESTLYRSDDAFVQKSIEEFGPHYRKIARPVWKCQAKALRKQSFTR